MNSWMTKASNVRNLALLGGVAFLVAACGGSGSGSRAVSSPTGLDVVPPVAQPTPRADGCPPEWHYANACSFIWINPEATTQR